MARALSDYYERAIFALLIFEYVFVNVAFSTETQNIVLIKDLSAPGLSLLILGLWILGDLARHGCWRLPRHALVPATVIALLVWSVSVFHSGYPEASLEEWSRMLTYFIPIWAMIRFLDTVGRIRAFTIWAFATNAALVGYGLMQLQGFDPLAWLGWINDWGQPVFISTHGNPNFFAGFMGSTWMLLAGLWLTGRHPLFLLTLPLLIACNFYGILRSDSRASYIAAAITATLFAAGLAANRRHLNILEEYWRKISVYAVGLLFAAVVVGGSLFASDKVLAIPRHAVNQLSSLTNLDKHFTNKTRLIFWQMAIDGGRRSPWLGRGIGTYNFNMPETRPPWYHRHGVTHNTDHAHQEYLEWFFDTGIIGLAAFLWVLAILVLAAVRELRRLRGHSQYPLLLAAALSPWGSLIQSAFDVESRWTGNGITLWCGAGLAMAFANLPTREAIAESSVKIAARPRASAAASPAIHPSPFLPVATAIVLIVLSGFTLKARGFWNADKVLAYGQFLDARQPERRREALALTLQARDLSPGDVAIRYRLGYCLLNIGRIPEALDAYRDLQSFAPNYAQIHSLLARFKHHAGFRTAAAAERDRAAAIEHNAENHLEAAATWADLGQPARALAHLRQVFTIEHDRAGNAYTYWYAHDEARLEAAKLLAVSGDTPAAIREARRVLDAYPEHTKAAIDLTALLRRSGGGAEADRLEESLARDFPGSPQALFATAARAVDERRSAAAITALEPLVLSLDLPSARGGISGEAMILGGAALSLIERLTVTASDRARSEMLVGWIFACQGRMEEGERFLRSAHALNPTDTIIQMLGAVQAMR